MKGERTMSELTELLEKVKLENLMGFMIYGDNFQREIFENYKQTIDKSYDDIFSRLEKLYSEVNRKDDELFDVIMDFSSLHDDIYFEAGVLIGFQLFKNLEQEYRKHGGDSILNIVSKAKGKKSVLEEIAEYRMDTTLEETLRTDKKYQEAAKRISEKVKKIDRNDFSTKQWEVIDEALSACNERSSEYGRVAYKQGLSDAVNLFKEALLLI